VRRKAAGKPIEAAEPERRQSNVISLMDALKQSLKSKTSARRKSHERATHRRPAKRAHRSAARRRRAS